MNAQKRLIIIKGKDKTDSVASFRFHDGKCDVVYTSSPGRIYSFQNRNVEILPLKKQIDPAQVIVTANGQTFGEIDEILDFGAYYRIIRAGRKDLSFHRSEVQFQRNCLADGKNKEAFQYFKETAAAISLVTDNGINILKMQYDKILEFMEEGKEYGIWDFCELLGLKESRTKDVLKGLADYIEIIGSNKDRRYRKK